MSNTAPAVIILAAGKGTRMKSDLPKVLHPVAGTPMLGHVINAGQPLHPAHTVVVVGYGAAEVQAFTTSHFPSAEFATQTEQKGTGHAVQQTQSVLANFNGDALITYGDVPLLQTATLKNLLTHHRASHAAITVVTANAPNPTGLGRILRDASGAFTGIREHKDCTPEELTITEVNTGLYAVQSPLVFKLLAQVQPNNTQGEYYLTDIIAIALAQGLTVTTMNSAQNPAELLGVNTPEQRAEAETLYLQRKSAA